MRNQLNREQNRASSTIRANTIVLPKDREVHGDIGGLVESIKTYGVLQPIGVRRVAEIPWLVWGHKRLLAVLAIDKAAEIEIIDLGEISDDEAAVAEIEENLRRHQYTEEQRAQQTARSVELRTKVIESRNAQAELSRQNVQKPNGRPPEARAEAVRQEAAAQNVSAKTIDRQLKTVGVGVSPDDEPKKAKSSRQAPHPRAHGKITKKNCTSWEALMEAYDGATKSMQRKLLEHIRDNMTTEAWSAFIATSPPRAIPPDMMVQQ